METSKPPKISTGYAHSKLILIGEHAVVYGKPAIAIPFPLKVTATIESREGEILLACSQYKGPLDKVPTQLRGIAICLKETFRYLNKPLRGSLIRLHSEIPLGRGLGSSAAIAIALVRSIFTYYEKPLSHRKLMELVHVAEVYAHGKPSGIDMEAVSSNSPIWFQKGQITQTISVGATLHLVVADSGQKSNTFSTVKKVNEKYKLKEGSIKKTIGYIDNIAKMAKVALSDGNAPLLGRLLDANHEELKKLGVSNKSLNLLVEISKKEGALGAKLTGGGCGGCILALARSLGHAEKLSKRLMEAGAQNTWYFTIEKNLEGDRDGFQSITQ